MPSDSFTLTTVLANDLYEIIVRGRSSTIVRYPRGIDCRGEEVDFDSLPPWIQRELYDLLKEKLRKQKQQERENEREENE